MTESEIMKALECCVNQDGSGCETCPLDRNLFSGKWCDTILMENALDLITDKNDSIEMYRRNIALLDEQILAKDKEIERLQKAIKSARNYAWQMKTEKENLIKTYKECQTEAIKEVYTRLSMNFGTYTDNDSVKLVDLFMLFDQIAKEMGVEL